jgi:hypothetical protein
MMLNLLRTPLVTGLLVGGAVAFLTVCSSPLSAQAQSMRVVRVTVTDPLNRFVSNIDQQSFQVVENGARRQITGFSNINSPIAVAIVSDSDSPLPVSGSMRPTDELIQTSSVSDALRQLMASKNPRKAMVVTNGADTRAIPSNVQVVQTNPDIVSKWVVELRNEYLLQFEASSANANVEVVLQQPQGLPPLRTHLK